MDCIVVRDTGSMVVDIHPLATGFETPENLRNAVPCGPHDDVFFGDGDFQSVLEDYRGGRWSVRAMPELR
jgi:hypothetical protein